MPQIWSKFFPHWKGHGNAMQDDGFLLWRMEMGFLLAGMLLGEGLSLLDLTAAPGWPGHLA